MVYLQFKDNSIYEKSKYSIIIRELFKEEDKIGVEIEYLSIDSNWNIRMPYEHQLKEWEEQGEDISFWSKYRKWQKRKLYTLEEFDRLFTYFN